MLKMTTSPVNRWNIFARELEDILALRGLRLTHLDDRAFIHREKVRRLRQSLLRPRSFPVLNPTEMDNVIVTFQLNDNEVLRLHAALLATAIEEMLMDRISSEDALFLAEHLFSHLLQRLEKGSTLEIQHVSGEYPEHFRWNIFARELEDILALRGLRLTHLDDRAFIHREKVRRLRQSLLRPRSFPVLNPTEMDNVIVTFQLNDNEVLRLRAALLATAIEEMLMDRISSEDALFLAEHLLPVLTWGVLTLDTDLHTNMQSDFVPCGPENEKSILLQDANPNENSAISSAINMWLDEKKIRTNSQRTIATYRDTLQQFRTYLHSLNLELNNNSYTLAKTVHEWASSSSPRRTQPAFISPATYNQRLSIVSSFYQYICSQELPIEAFFCNNPVDLVLRASLEESKSAPVLDQEAMKKRLILIDQSTLQGKRDYALLWVILTTNCQASELAGLRYGHIKWTSTCMAIIWEGRHQTKQEAFTVLVTAAAQALKEYLYAIYENTDPNDIIDNLPIWVSFSQRNHFQAISTQTIADICQKHLGVPTVHALRQLFFPKGV
jgi:site-specific recombinase XerD